jgi:sulfhydrogenase subunit alpha
MSTRVIKVNQLARVEGEGSLIVRTHGEDVEEVRLSIFEPPRFFEAFLRGRSYLEVPDITARICGICPVAYQMSSIHALEDAFGVEVPDHIKQLRRLLYCGEWIQSHVLHILMLHAPDYLGFPSVIEMAKEHQQMVELGLRLKRAGNRVIEVLGGREVHPVNARVGGFWTLPEPKEWQPVLEDVARARSDASRLLDWVAGFSVPMASADYDFVALVSSDAYPFCEGWITSSKGPRVNAREFEQTFKEFQVPHSTALHSRRVDGGTYLTGPMARIALNAICLLEPARAAWERLNSTGMMHLENAYNSILVRCVEIVQVVEEAHLLLQQLVTGGLRGEPFVPVRVCEGVGCAATEAPRGLLYHRYNVDADGLITEAKIVPPTAQNQAQIESDLTALVRSHLHANEDQLRHLCEQMIRNHDPCISCATHFLNFQWNRGTPE